MIGKGEGQIKRIVKILGPTLILAVLVLGSFPQALTLAQNPQPSSKVSSLLSLQVEAKLRLSQGQLPGEMASILWLNQDSERPQKASTGVGSLSTHVYLFTSLSHQDNHR